MKHLFLVQRFISSLSQISRWCICKPQCKMVSQSQTAAALLSRSWASQRNLFRPLAFSWTTARRTCNSRLCNLMSTGSRYKANLASFIFLSHPEVQGDHMPITHGGGEKHMHTASSVLRWWTNTCWEPRWRRLQTWRKRISDEMFMAANGWCYLSFWIFVLVDSETLFDVWRSLFAHSSNHLFISV